MYLSYSFVLMIFRSPWIVKFSTHNFTATISCILWPLCTSVLDNLLFSSWNGEYMSWWLSCMYAYIMLYVYICLYCAVCWLTNYYLLFIDECWWRIPVLEQRCANVFTLRPFAPGSVRSSAPRINRPIGNKPVNATPGFISIFYMFSAHFDTIYRLAQ